MREVKFIKIASNPLFIAAVLSLIALPFLFKQVPKYKMRITKDVFLSRPESCVTWADVNDDGESENIEWFVNTEGNATLKIINQQGMVINQKGFDGQCLIMRNPPYYFDLNSNRIPEIYVFYHRKDSLFFSAAEFDGEAPRSIVNEAFVDMVTNWKGDKDYTVDCTAQGDLNRDSVSEFIFTVSAGYPLVPRNVYSYSFRTHELKKSVYIATQAEVSYITDINGDGRNELLITQYAPGNMKDSLTDKANDLSVRLLVLNDHLVPVFDPPVFEGKFSSISPVPYMLNGKSYIVAYVDQKKDNIKHDWLLLYSPDGKLIARRKAIVEGEAGNLYLLVMNISKHPVHLLSRDGILTTYNSNLEPVKKKTFRLRTSSPDELDINEDGQKEFLMYDGEFSDLVIARANLKNMSRLRLPIDKRAYSTMYLKKNNGKPNELSVQYGGKYCLVSYFFNPFYPFRFLFWLLSFVGMAGFTFFIQYLQRLAFRDRYLNERKVSELQLLLMRNQITPHFLFNAINSISYRLMEKNPEEANNSIIRLSRLIRNTLVSTDSFSRSLQEELDITIAWVDIVRTQTENPFTFRSEVQPGVNRDIQVPVMVIQGLVENAVKHGVRTLVASGLVSLSVSQDNKYLHIVISDNGVGRKKSAENVDKSHSTGKGTELMNQFFTELNKYNENKIKCTITDLSGEDGFLAGTVVTLDIPVNLKFRLYE